MSEIILAKTADRLLIPGANGYPTRPGALVVPLPYLADRRGLTIVQPEPFVDFLIGEPPDPAMPDAEPHGADVYTRDTNIHLHAVLTESGVEVTLTNPYLGPLMCSKLQIRGRAVDAKAEER